MPRLKISVAHSLDRQTAVERLKGFLDQVKAQYQDRLSNLEEEWDEFNGRFKFSAMGFSSEGTISVEEDEVRVDGKLPLAAMIIKGQIEETIRGHLEKVLA
jgi:hypothetical protein